MRQMPTWAASPSLHKVEGRSDGAVACARLGGRTGGKRASTIALMAGAPPCDAGRAVCPCNDLAHNHPEVAEEWDWEANGKRAPKTVAAGSLEMWSLWAQLERHC